MKIRIQILLLSILIGLNSCANKTHKNGLHSDVNSVSIDSEIIDFIRIGIADTTLASISGKIYAKSINKNDTLTDNLAFANIWVKDIKTDSLIGTTSNSKGEFQFTIPVSEYDLEVQFIGFNNLKVKNVKIGTGDIINFSGIIGQGNSVTEYKWNPNVVFEKTSDFKYPELISDFVSSEWGKVFKAKDSLLNIGTPVIADLIKLMDNPKAFEKLQNTADLIYPGATEYWGHGWVIDYDLDWIAIRAGWAMENLTSQHFGFSENVITEKELMDLHKKDYANYIETGIHDVNFKRQKFKELDVIIAKAKDWWKNKENWTPLSGLKEAIFSDDINRQLDAIQQMRFTRFKIKGYNREWFDQEIKARIIELNKTDNEELKLQTGYLLRN
jgi:hypothetical protein